MTEREKAEYRNKREEFFPYGAVKGEKPVL